MPRIKYDRFKVEVLSLYEPPLRAIATWRQVRQVLEEFEQIGLVWCSDIKPVAVARWIKAHPDRSPARTASLLRTFAAACSYARSAGYLTRTPFDFRKVSQWVRGEVLAPDRPGPPRHLTPDEITRLLQVADDEAALGSWDAGRLQVLVYLFAFLFLRKGEALNLKTADVDLAAGVIAIQSRRHHRLKTRASSARLPAPAPLLHVLRLWVPRTGCEWLIPGRKRLGPWTGGKPGDKALDQMKALGKRAGINNLTILAFRKTAGTYGKSWGFSQLELKALLRHSNVGTQAWYDEESIDALRGTVAKIQFGPQRAVL